MSEHRTEDAKGRAKEAAGAVTGDKDLKKEGKADQASASAKGKLESAVDKVKDKITGN
ncbi:MAG: CsbD family protein [Solirubrobacterales bacterium]|nr:CsbD family protein [Solirubrobacterales bacterium]